MFGTEKLLNPLDVVGPERDFEIPQDLGGSAVSQTADLLGALVSVRIEVGPDFGQVGGRGISRVNLFKKIRIIFKQDRSVCWSFCR